MLKPNWYMVNLYPRSLQAIRYFRDVQPIMESRDRVALPYTLPYTDDIPPIDIQGVIIVQFSCLSSGHQVHLPANELLPLTEQTQNIPIEFLTKPSNACVSHFII